MAEAGALFVGVLPDLTKFPAAMNTGMAKAGVVGGNALNTNVAKTTQSLGSKLKSQFSALGPLLGVTLGAGLAKASLDAAAEAQKVNKQLETSLGRLGKVGEDAYGSIVEWADKLQFQTGIDDEEIKTITSRLSAMGTEFFKAAGPNATKALEQITQGLLDMAAATGKSTQMLMRSLGPDILNTPEKAIPLLQKYGVLTDEQAQRITNLAAQGDKAAATQAELNAITEKFGGTAAKTATPTEKLGVLLGEMQETIGRALLPMLKLLAQVLTPIFNAFSALPGPIQSTVVAVGLAAGAIKLFGGSIDGAITAIKRFGLSVGGMIGNLGVAAAGFGVLAGSVVAVAAPIAAFVLAQQAVKEVTDKTASALKAGGQALEDWAKKVDHAQNVTHSIFGQLAEFVPGFRDIKDGIDESADAIDRRLTKALHNSLDPLAGVADKFKAAATEARALANTQVARAMQAAGVVLGHLNDVLGFTIDKTKSTKENIAALAQAQKDWVDATAGQLNFVSGAFGDLATKEGQSVAGLQAGLAKSLASMKRFGANLATIARDGGKGAQELVKQLLALGPAGASMAQKLVDAGKRGRAGIEGQLGAGLRQSHTLADNLGIAFRVLGDKIARAIIIGTTPLKDLKAKLAALDGTKVDVAVVPHLDLSGMGFFTPFLTGAAAGIHAPQLAAATGFHGTVTGPTSFLAGERGPERVDIGPGGSKGTGQLVVKNTLRVDRRHFLDGQDYELRYGGPA